MELKQSKDQVKTMRKEGKLAISKLLRPSFGNSPLLDIPTLGPNDEFVLVGDRLKGPCPSSPLVVGTIIECFGLPGAHYDVVAQRHMCLMRTLP